MSKESRQSEIKQARRRRETLGEERGLKLHIPESAKDPNFTYRFVNDRPGRVRQMTEADDWDVVSDAALNRESISEGTVVKRVADKFSGEQTVLLRKRKEYHEADEKKKFDALNAVDEALRKGPPPSSDGLSGPSAYVPGGRNIVNGQ